MIWVIAMRTMMLDCTLNSRSPIRRCSISKTFTPGSPSYPDKPPHNWLTLVSQGAKLVIFNSDDMKDEALKFAKAHPDIYVIGSSDDWTWKDGKNYQDSPNQFDIMGRMEYMKMIAGCAAALTTKTGKVGYLGPLINDEPAARFQQPTLEQSIAGQISCTRILQFKVTWI